MRAVLVLLVLVAVVGAGACAPDVALTEAPPPSDAPSDPPAAGGRPAGPPFVRGPLVSVTTAEPVATDCVSEADLDPDGTVSSDDPPVCNPELAAFGSLHVKGQTPEDSETEIVVTVDPTTPLVRRGAAGDEPVDFSELAEGDVVSVWITGPVMESYPLQGTASYILVED